VNANSTHLDLEDLIAEVTGRAIGDQVREHLADCEQCQLEVNRWSLVADGVRDLAAEAERYQSLPGRRAPDGVCWRVLGGEPWW
jgi:hypothetical protein